MDHHRHSRATKRWRARGVAAALGISAFGGAFAVWQQPAAAFCSSRILINPCEHDEDSHEQMNVDGLGFLNPGALGEMHDEHEFMDWTGQSAADKHFDNCRFGGSIAEINERWDGDYAEAGVIEEFDPADPSPLDAADEFGQILHVAQDFYSHSNWVELGRTDLFESGLDRWQGPSAWGVVRDDIVVVGEDLPAGWTAGPMSGFVPSMTTDQNTPVRGLISGSTAPDTINDECHDAFTVPHDEGASSPGLNKDRSSRPRYAEARALAVRQSTHEWCRMLHLLDGEYGLAGPATAMGLWLGNGASAHAAGTPCAAGPAGSVAVTVSATNVTITEDTDDFSSAEINLRLLVLTDDLKQSVMSQSPRTTVDEPQTISGPPSVTLCVDPSDSLAVSVQGWDDDDQGDNSGGIPGVFDDEDNDDDEALAGVTSTVGAAQTAAGTYSGSSNNMDVTFSVQVTNDSDGDGLTDCAEAELGTLPNDPDSDHDGLNDGDEVHTNYTNPLDPDSDDDGLNDGDEVHTHGTNPNKADTDGDLITDGDEVHTYGTDPLEGDSDDDGLSDGEEIQVYGTKPNVADTDGEGLIDGDEVHVHDTNPLEPDTDFDGLDDLIEVTYGTDPNSADSDGDGLADGDDVEFLEHAVGSVPASAFKSTGGGSQAAVLAILETVEASLLHDNEAAALKQLANLQSRLDGCGWAADSNDWITDCAAQLTVRSLIELLTANITT
jgi:hypothetical protein